MLPLDTAAAQDAEATKPRTPPRARQFQGRTLTATVADYAAATSLARIPPEVLDRARKVVFDEMACAYFGCTSPGATAATRHVAGCGSPGEARIYGTALRASAPYAAMANGTAGHGYEVDGTHVVGGHPGASIVHTVTAIAEKQNASGAELLNAVILAYDVGVRIVEACGGKFSVRDRRHLTSDFFYAMGGTAAAARILKLSPTRHRHALALVTFQTNGLYALYAEKDHISKSFCNGQYAFAAISSAQMAQAGLEGNEDIIGSAEGVLDAWGDGRHDDAVVAGLGRDFKIMGANFKFYNAGYPIHTPIEAVQTIIRQNAIANDAIQSILIGMPQNAMKVVDNREMHNISVQDMVAANLAKGGLKLVDEPFPAILSDPTYKRLRTLISVAVDPELQSEFPNGRGARVTIVTRDGKRHVLRIDNPRGHSLRGDVSWDDLAEKWRGSLPNCDPGRALEIARNLDKLTSAKDLFAAFAGTNG
ncbi:MmgE/PrpD family protein [Sphingomonas ginsenosidivorax]|uniref:MmgE/PrpD family protein n=2 Tax=Sphingomonas ginsenosidivorax TaxID=862135 RepID=A0A5C6UK92_9SPHN|nr:MmgE/PrpD family protein [Sphingomonas ginsenosidivorax]